jgi:hypothetical protein
LFESTGGMQNGLPPDGFHWLQPADRAALMLFGSGTRLVLPFTDDRTLLEKALHRIRPSGRGEAHTFDAVVEAAALFQKLPPDSGRTRAIVIVFGTENENSKATFDQAQAVLLKSQIRLYAVAVQRFDPKPTHRPVGPTPPTFPGPAPPIYTNLAPLPERTLHAMEKLAAATGGGARPGKYTLAAVTGQARSTAQQPQKFRLVAGEHVLDSNVPGMPHH